VERLILEIESTFVRSKVPVLVMEDQHQMILGHHILWEGGDRDGIMPLLEQAQQRWPQLNQVSLDKGFWSPEIYQQLDECLELAVLPKKGKPNQCEQQRQAAAEFVAARRQHPAIESAINALEHCGLDRVLSYGAEGFERMVGLAIIAANAKRIGRWRRQQLIEQAQRQRVRFRRAA